MDAIIILKNISTAITTTYPLPPIPLKTKIMCPLIPFSTMVSTFMWRFVLNLQVIQACLVVRHIVVMTVEIIFFRL